MRLTAAMVAVIGGLLAVLLARSTWAAECAADDDRIDFANVTFCISKTNDLYRYTVDEFLGLQFAPQTFIGDRRVPSESYYDAHGNAPVDGTYVTVSVKPPRFGQFDVQKYRRMKGILSDMIAGHADESVFEFKTGTTRVSFRRLDGSTIVGTQIVAEDDVQVSEVWFDLDGAGQVQHMSSCGYWPSRQSSMECMSWIPIGTSIAKVRLSGGTQERSYRLSRQIRSDIEGFIAKGASP